MTTTVSRKIVLHFSRQTWDQPLVYHLAKDFDLTFNILKAEITPNAEGMVLLELSGRESEYRKGVRFLKDRGVRVESLSQEVTRDEAKCTHCGACLAVCPTEALDVDRSTWLVSFDPQRCIGCNECVNVCLHGGHAFVDGVHIYRRENCVICGDCAEGCFAGALQLTGRPVTVGEVMQEVVRDRPFYETSAMVNPLDMDLIDSLSFKTKLSVVPCVTTPTEIQAAVNRHYYKTVIDQAREHDVWWTILLVDDQEVVRAAAAAALKREGYTLLEAENGAEGIRLAVQKRPHLIISDTVMPRMDGYEMFRALKSNQQTGHIPIIALSSKSSAEEEAKLLDMGFFDFIGKPINPVRLVARVKRALHLIYGDSPPPR